MDDAKFIFAFGLETCGFNTVIYSLPVISGSLLYDMSVFYDSKLQGNSLYITS